MKLIFFIAKRYLFLSKNTRAINILSFITMFAMGGGAAALLIVLSTFNGFETLAISLYESYQPSLIVESKRNKTFEVSYETLLKLSKVPNIQAISKVVEEKAYFKYRDKETLGVLKGVDSSYFHTNEVQHHIIVGDTLLEDEDYSYALLGAGMSDKLGVNYESSISQIEVYAPKSDQVSGMGLLSNFELSYLTPRSMFSIYQEFDDKFIIAPIAMVQYLYQLESTQVTALEVKTTPTNESAVTKDIQEIVGNQFVVKNRLESNQTLYKITKIEKMAVILIMTFILLILSFNFIGSLTMHIIEKTKDIKTLKYLGWTSQNIQHLYLTIGVMQGLIGGLIGMFVGYLICIGQQKFGWIQMPGNGTFVINAYPVEIRAWDVLIIFGIIVLISFVASLYPSRLARKI